MPWHATRSDQCPAARPWAVIKDDTGEKVACHPTEEAAQRHVAALYANAPEAERAQMTAKAIDDLPDSAFAYIEPGGKKDAEGKTVPRSKRHFPLHDEAHVRNALSRAPQSPFGDKAMPKIRAAAKKLGIGEPAEASRSEPAEYTREFALDGIEILRAGKGGGDGRTVEAYAAVFDQPTEVTDQHGHYMEVIERTAFYRTLSHGIDRVGVFYNHGRDLDGKPANLGHVPIGSPVEIKADVRGLRTVTRFNRSSLADSVLEAIRNDDIRGYSFRGGIFRSDPRRPPRARAGGSLPTWRHHELGLREYGPTWIPVYAGAGILAVRSALSEAQRLIDTLSPSTHHDPDDEHATPDVGPGTADPPEGHSGRLQMVRFRAAVRDRGL